MLAQNALEAIGHTPLVRLKSFEPKNGAEIWIKLEGGNPTGSYKDRMALSVLSRAMERGNVRQGDRVVEYTGGSTGTALATDFSGMAGTLGFAPGQTVKTVRVPVLKEE